MGDGAMAIGQQPIATIEESCGGDGDCVGMEL
eukprot:COSAG04_NODE_18178_length_449_cov_0.748571_1_plen_32_part_00